MFSTIFKYELKYWFKKPSFYIYAILFLVISIVIAANKAGVFDEVTATTGSSLIANSSMQIANMFNTLASLIFFLFPSIIGYSIYRDYKSEMHTILYSYPFTKTNYLLAKFFSGVTIVTLIVLMVGLGMVIGFRLPGTNQNLVGAFNFMSYLQTYLLYILPNILLYGAIIFAVVVFTRKIITGFITFIILLLIQATMVSLLTNPDYAIITALLDPTGSTATLYYTKYWTVAEQNTLYVPIKELMIYNRLLWMGIALLIFGLVSKFFKFTQNPISFSFKKPTGDRIIKSNFGSITRVILPKVGFDFSFAQFLKITWKQSNIDYKYIVKSVPFIAILIIGMLMLVIDYYGGNNFRGTTRFPVTWRMMHYVEGYQLAIIICTFLYAGMVSHRSKIANINLLVDTAPIPNWTLVIAKLLALFKMQLLMITVILITAISFQIYKGYYNFEIGHYLFELYVLNFIYFALWAMLALFVQTLIKNPYLGLIVLFIIFMIVSASLLSYIGVDQSVFIFNKGGGYRYSDMNGYGDYLSSNFIYNLYWLLAGTLFLIGSKLFLVRGLPYSFKERLAIAKSRFKGKVVIGFGILLVAFLSMGFSIYYENNVLNMSISSKEREQILVDLEKKYTKFKDHAQPKIVSVKIDLDIFPKELNFNVKGTYVLVNKSEVAIDSIFLKHNEYPSTFKFDQPNTLVSNDTLFRFNIYHLQQSLKPGDSLELNFIIKNKTNTLLNTNSPVLANGTFMNSFELMPTFGYKGRGITDNAIRKKYDLLDFEKKAHPSDSTALEVNGLTRDADWVDFEATVSTSEDQIAIAPGYLQKEWIKDGRRYFHYKMDSKMLNIYSFNSARYEVKNDTWKDVALEIYYHKGHEYNLDRMMAGMKASLDYNSKNFSTYQHKQLRIIEFPRIYGSFAQSYPNTIPFSESHGFIADVDDSDVGGVDFAFGVTSHEVAHQWWAHQVMGADVLGASMLSESVSEYVRLKTLEHEYGKGQMRTFLKYALDRYLRGRKNERIGEDPLMYIDGQSYIRYSKGSLVFYALSDYIGEENLNSALRKLVEKNKFQGPPYTTSIELVDYIREVTPDSLQYVIKDMFETITLYKNKVVDYKTTKLDNGKYQIDIEFNVSKYRSDAKGKKIFSDDTIQPLTYKNKSLRQISSLPLADYIDVGVFGEEEIDGEKKAVALYLQKHKITTIHNKITIIVDQKPTEVGVDPYHKLIDTDSKDNRLKTSDVKTIF
jgi:ABC-2 type transport system permease protein